VPVRYAEAVPESCVICRAVADPRAETTTVASNVRAFAHQTFALWRCDQCRSIHARDSVDLDAYYRDYPFARARPSRISRYFHRRLWRRLRRAGVGANARVLDYGCGAGLLVADLRRRGVAAAGYDAYDARYQDRAPLSQQYDCVLAQDVIEHVDDPRAMLATIAAMTGRGGHVAIGTPDADAIDLTAAAGWKHTLHQPYHRHVLSRAALTTLADELGWRLVRYHPTPYTNTPVPTLNTRYLVRYLRAVDDTLDVAFEPPRLRLAMLTPAALFDALFGGLRCPPGDGLAIFATP
jgi:2-polyprenyl-3-methyl-5-hydroxy-6-metoxy-1,4-benzoquinol methylase